ncbi:MAG TPA: TlpA disulfide reductase family protein [Bryobacteraceae bacterium]|nr:TlpA disulfide reductase family protein [Bryobacteraceae bacterium]
MKHAILLLAVTAGLTPIDESGYQKMVAAHKGKVVLVDFWATWCKPCRAEMPELVKLDQKLRARGFELVTISADEPEAQPAALKVLKENNVAGVTYLKKAADDDKFADAIDPKWGGALPGLFLYDRSGKKVRSFIGETPVKDLEAAIQKIL